MELKCLECNKLFKKKYTGNMFCSIVCSNRHHLNHKIKLLPPTKYSKELAEVFGILLGDGSVQKYFVKVYLNIKADKGYGANVVKLFNILFTEIKIATYLRPTRGTEEIQISSRDASDYFRSIGFNPKIRDIPQWILNEETFVKAALRGLFDTEGCIGIKHFKGKRGSYVYKQLTFTNSNKLLLRFVENSLCKLGFSPTKNSKKNIYLSNRQDIKRYFEIIGTSNPKLVKKYKLQ